MNGVALQFGTAGQSASQSQLRVNVTNSGFEISEMATSKYDQAFFAETLTKLIGVLMIPAGGIVLFLPKIAASNVFLFTHIAILAAFVLVGVSVHRYADRGFRRRVQVDTTRREVRIGTVNLDGDFHLRSTYVVNDIESFFIIRSKDTRTPAKLHMRLKSGTHTVGIVEGSERALMPILERITLGLQPPQMRNRRVRTKTTGKFIRMTIG